MRVAAPAHRRLGSQGLPHIYDNKSELLAPALNAALGQAVAFDTCIGYLNLRGWQLLAGAIDTLDGVPGRPDARVLIGMAARPDQLVRERYRVRRTDEDPRVTLGDVPKLRDEVLRDFRSQLTVGTPTAADEGYLRRFRDQLAGGKVRVKFFARHPLHAKLYLAQSRRDEAELKALADKELEPKSG